MLLLTSKFFALASLIKLILLLVLFVFLLVLASWFTKWYANSSVAKNRHRNISFIEASPLGTGKSIQIIRVGKRYIVLAVCKDTVTKLMEISEDELELTETDSLKTSTFKEMLQELVTKKDGVDKNEEEK